MEQDSHPYSLRDFLTTIFKHKHKIWIVFMTTVITVTVGSFVISPTYEAKTSLMVKLGRENIYRPEIGNTNKVFSADPEKILNTEIKILTSQDLMEKVIQKIGVKNIYPGLAKRPQKNMTPVESAVKKFTSKISVGISRNSDIIDITFQHPDPNVAARTLNLLVVLFQEKHTQVFGSSLSSLFGKQLKVYEKKLLESEMELKAFKKKHQIFSYGEQSSLLLKQRIGLDTSLKETQNLIGGLEQKLSSLKNQLLSIPEKDTVQLSSGANRYQIIDETKANLLALKRKESELLRKYKNFDAGNYMLSSVRDEIKLVEEFLAKQEKKLKENVGTEKNVLHEKIKMELIKAQADLKSLGAKEKNIKRQVSLLGKNMVVLDQKGQEFKMLSRKLLINEKNFEMYMRKLEEANVSKLMDGLKMDNISVIQEATVPANPIKPNKRLNVIMSVFLGAFSGIGLAFLFEYLGHGISTPREVENRLGLPVIATVSYKG